MSILNYYCIYSYIKTNCIATDSSYTWNNVPLHNIYSYNSVTVNIYTGVLVLCTSSCSYTIHSTSIHRVVAIALKHFYYHSNVINSSLLCTCIICQYDTTICVSWFLQNLDNVFSWMTVISIKLLKNWMHICECLIINSTQADYNVIGKVFCGCFLMLKCTCY